MNASLKNAGYSIEGMQIDAYRPPTRGFRRAMAI
jgi:hypothetical protein